MRLASPAAALLAAIACQATAQTRPYLDFQGRALVVLSDADMVASAYVDGDLGPRPEGLLDSASVIELGAGPRATMPSARVGVSNAVTAWPSNLAIAPDGTWAAVTELGAPAPRGATRFDQLRPGRSLTLIDLADRSRPRIVGRRELAGTTVATAAHPSGRLLAVTLRDAGPGRRFALLAVNREGVGEPAYMDLPGATSDAAHVEWHPSGRFLAVTFADRDEVRFYEFAGTDGQAPALRPWGGPVKTGPLPGVGYFTPDGRHLLVTNLHWGPSVSGTYLGTQSATMVSIRFDGSPESGSPRHLIVSSAPIGGSPENFAISPTGDFVVALNMEQSYAPAADPRHTPHSSLTALTLDRATGRLYTVGTYPFDGILPEGITFDASGRYLAIANFQSRNPARGADGTTLDYWEVVQSGPVPTLVQLDFKTRVPRGAHIVKLIR